MAYREWPGPAAAPTLLCVHGLTRNGRDFDIAAESLSAHYRVICPDMPGRGLSDNLPDSAQYNYALYLADLAALIARLDVESLDWLGTSMGGLIGMMMAATPGAPNPAIGDQRHRRGRRQGGAGAHRQLCRPGSEVRQSRRGRRCDGGQFRRLRPARPRDDPRPCRGRSAQLPDGRYGWAYDPHIGDAFKAAPPQDVDLWGVSGPDRLPDLGVARRRLRCCWPKSPRR